MRLFVAVFIPPDVRRLIDSKIKEDESLSGIRWIPSAHFHLTLKFLGRVEGEQVAALCASLRLIAGRTAPFRLSLAAGGVFPDARRPRVFWTGAQGSIGRLGVAAQAVEEACEALGFPLENRRFKPHLTIGRADTARPGAGASPTDAPDESPSAVTAPERGGVQAAERFCALFSGFASPEFPVGEMHLVQSHIDTSGARYEVLETFPFSSAA